MDVTKFHEHLLRTSFTEAEYDLLARFFQDVWLSDAAYKVFMARRAFNLNYAFMDVMSAQYGAEYKTEGIISNTALLLCAEEIAEYYRMTESFPKIILVDDLLIHGRGIMKLMDNLECLVADFLRDVQGCNVSRQSIHSKLVGAVSIYVYGQNTDGVLLDKQFSLKCVTRLPAGELKGLSQRISRALQRCGVANTSYVLSGELPWDFFRQEYDRGFDRGVLFPYRGNTLRYYYRNSGSGIMETIRFYRAGDGCFPRGIVTSLAVFGDIPYQRDDPHCAFNDLCRSVAGEIRQIIPYSRIAGILSYEEECLVRSRAQMLAYLLSIFGYCRFYQEKVSDNPQTIYKALLQSDYQKIASNFDRPKKLQLEMVQLFNYVSQGGPLCARMYEQLERCAGGLGRGLQGSPDSCQVASKWRPGSTGETHLSVETLHEIAEDVFYEVGMNAECDANQCIQQQSKFDTSRPGSDFIRLEQYLAIMERRGFDVSSSMGCALNLMDSGLLAMNLDLDASRGAVQCILKAGELSTFVLPRRFSVFVPALSIVERGCAKIESSRRVAVSRFIDYLQGHCYQQDGADCPEDTALLKKLRRSKVSLLYMYVAGQSFQDWDVNLLTDEDRLSHGVDELGNFSQERYSAWVANESKRIRYYNYCARTFLHAEKR